MKNPAKQVHRTESQIRQLLNRYNEKIITVTEFCKANKIHKATFYNWRKKYGHQQEMPAGFIPVRINQAGPELALFAEIELSAKCIIRLYQKVGASYFKTLVK